jgi:hypothetical protein
MSHITVRVGHPATFHAADHLLSAAACCVGNPQLGWPDMRLPIMYTMSWPERVPVQDATWPRLDFSKASSLTFKKPDNEKYPSMNLAYAAGRAGGTMTGVLSAANEQVGQGGVWEIEVCKWRVCVCGDGGCADWQAMHASSNWALPQYQCLQPGTNQHRKAGSACTAYTLP